MSDGTPPVERLTPLGAGGVAVIAVRTAEARRRLAELHGRALPEPGAIAYGGLREPGESVEAPPIDEVLLVGRPGGLVEVHLHGGPAVVSDVLTLLGASRVGEGRRPLRARRPLEERAALAAVNAPTDLGARILLDQAAGALRSALEALVDSPSEERAAALRILAARGRRARRLLTPATVVLVGPVNAGKSTLVNVLAGEDVAVVTEVPGTTRDALGVHARLGPWPVVLVDTAGERWIDAPEGDGAAEIERAGQALGRDAAARADLVLTLVPDGAHAPEVGDDLGRRPSARITTMAALRRGHEPRAWGDSTISALEQPDHARATIAAAFAARLDPGPAHDPLWAPGRPVPFEADLVERMVDLATPGRVGRSALASLLEEL